MGAGRVWVAVVVALAATFRVSEPASAHPHVWIDAVVEAVFDAEGRFTAVHEIWAFDYEFGDIVKLQMDADGNRRYDDAELAHAASNFLAFIPQGNYFTRITVAGRPVEHGAAADFQVRVDAGRLIVEFTLPLLEPQVITLGAGIDVYDGEYYHEFNFAPRGIRAVAAPANCALGRREQPNVDPVAVMLLRRLGLTADPAIMNDPAAGYAVRVAVDCAI